jgi:hypothetical protein
VRDVVEKVGLGLVELDQFLRPFGVHFSGLASKKSSQNAALRLPRISPTKRTMTANNPIATCLAISLKNVE